MRAVTKTSITVDKSTLERFNALREECKTDYTPAPSADSMVNRLIDEWEHNAESTGQGYAIAPTPNNPDGVVPIEDRLDVLETTKKDIEQLMELVEHVPDRTADELEGRFGGHP